MNFNEIMESRRSINFFDPDKNVSQDLLQRLIETAAKAPSGFNQQPWNLLVLRQKEEKERLLPLASNQPKIVEAPVVLVVLADKDGWREEHATTERNWQEMLAAGDAFPEKRNWFIGALQGLYGGSADASLAFAVKNASFFSMALMLAATDLGLETHPMDGFDREAVRKEFNVPENFWVPLLIAVGYRKPGLTLLPAKWRKSYKDIVVSF